MHTINLVPTSVTLLLMYRDGVEKCGHGMDYGWSAYHCVHGTSGLCIISTPARFLFRNLFMETCVV